MLAYLLYIAAALYLGVLTSISPCPLATNIAAVSYVGRRLGNSRWMMAAGLLYTLGRCLLYVALAAVLAATAMSVESVARFLQSYVHLLLGPIFLLLGMFLVGLITFSGGGATMSEQMQKRIDSLGVWGALLLGILFAVAFCPTSAAWFFGLLALILGAEAGTVSAGLATVGITLPTTSLPGGIVLLPLIYGIGTALPVLLVTFLLVYSVQSVGKAYNALAKTEWWARQITGWLFVLGGVYLSLRYCFDAG
jgi:cytochrome c-type biogenesis protein